MRTVRIAFAVLFVLLSTLAAQAVTYIVPPDNEMIQLSDDIVVATGVTSLAERTDTGGIVTRYTLRIEEVLKGNRAVGDYLVLTEQGGLIGEEIQFIPGTPSYEPGERYLVFTEANNRLEPVTFGMGLGQFFFSSQRGQRLALRAEVEGFNHNLDNYVERARDSAGFLDYIRGVVSQTGNPEPHYFVKEVPARFEAKSNGFPIAAEASRGSYLMSASGHPFRWETPVATFVTSGTPQGPDGIAASDLAVNQWNSTASSINYHRGAQDNTAVGGIENNKDTHDGKNAVLFNDPNNQVGSGIAGVGGITRAVGTHTIDGEEFWSIKEIDVVMNDGSFQQNCYNTVMVHEVGHTLGFRHSNEAPAEIATSNAIMNWQVTCGWNGVLKDYDKAAAAAVYGSGATCNAPSISTQPANKTITPPATSTTLSVTASGTGTLTYQWYQGTSGDTSNPIGTTNPITVSPTSTTTYWVRVSNTCGNTNSNTVTVTIAGCQPPNITSQSSSRTITSGEGLQLTVTAGGTTPLHYQWYIGAVGDTTTPTGSDNKNLTVSPNTTTTYWVRVTGACGDPDDSAAIVITVNACPSITLGAPTATTQGANAVLDIAASSNGANALTYRWFRGDTPGTGGTPVGTTKSITVAVTPQVQNYWVVVTNSCNRSALSTLVAVASCSLPAVEAQPADQTILTGTNATLSLLLVGDGTGVTVTWYRGTAPDKTNQVGTGTSITVGPLSENTSYWAAVKNSCGEIFTRTALVTINQAPVCIAPAITTSPITQQVPANTTALLSVVATGTSPLTYQWYEGAKGDTTTPIAGATAETFTTANILSPTSYWVRVTNGCGTIDSEAALITTPPGRRRAAAHR